MSETQNPYPNWPSQPPGEIKRYTKLGVLFMFIGLIFMFFINIVALISSLGYYILISDSTSYMESFYLITITSGIRGFLFIIFIILIILSITFFYLGRFEFGEKHEKNVIWAIAFFITYLIFIFISFFGLTLLLIENPLENVYLYTSLSSVLYIIESFLLAFFILLVVQEYVGTFEKEILYIVVSILILLPLVDTLILIFGLSGIVTLDHTGYMVYSFILIIFEILTWALAIFAFYRIFKCFDPYNRYITKETKKILPRPKPIASYVGTFYSKPVTSLIIIIVIAIILGAGVGTTFPDLSGYSESSDGSFFDDFEFIEHSVYEDGNTVLQEMESQDFTIPIDGHVDYIHILVGWEDEPDQYPLINQPDMFTVELYYGDYFDSGTGENPHGDSGAISFEKVFADAYEYHSNSVEISIILTYAGDQTGPGGWFSVQSDNSNEVYYEFVITYSTEE